MRKETFFSNDQHVILWNEKIINIIRNNFLEERQILRRTSHQE